MRQVRMIRNVRLGVKNLLLHKMRSMLTVLGVVFGVGSVIAMLAVGEGASEQALEQIRKLGSRNIILTSMKPAEDEQAGTQRARMGIYGLLYEDEIRIRESLPTVRRTVPVKLIRREGRLGERAMELRLVGTTPDWFELVDRPLVAGRVITQRDTERRANVCVLTEHGARRLLAGGHTIGQSLRIGSDYYEIIGIIQSESGGGSIQTPDQEADAYVPIVRARDRYGDITIQRSAGSSQMEMVELHQILVEVAEDRHVEPAAAAILAMLERFRGGGGGGGAPRIDYRVYVPLALQRQAEATRRTFNIVLGSIAGISLLVGGIGIMNIMLASVTERTREIGIRRAIGAKRHQIIAQFLVETVVLSSIGGLIGIGMGLLLPWLITYFAGMPTIVPVYSVVLSLGISVGVGVIFGLYPAVRAAKLDPIVALRHE